MAYVPQDDFERIFEMGVQSEKRKQQSEKRRERDGRSSRLRRQDRIDDNFTILCSIACAIFILFGLLLLTRELAWWLT